MTAFYASDFVVFKNHKFAFYASTLQIKYNIVAFVRFSHFESKFKKNLSVGQMNRSAIGFVGSINAIDIAVIQGPPKKSVVMSGEAMKEVQKQAKATKDERRLQVS